MKTILLSVFAVAFILTTSLVIGLWYLPQVILGFKLAATLALLVLSIALALMASSMG